MKKGNPKTRVKMMLLPAALVATLLVQVGFAFNHISTDNVPNEIASGLKKDILSSVQGAAVHEQPRISTTENGYLRFIGAPYSSYFPVGKHGKPDEVADAFLSQRRNLFVNNGSMAQFHRVRVKTRGSRTYVRYNQRYAGLKVFGAELIVQVNSDGIACAISDIMSDTRLLDSGTLSLYPLIAAVAAQEQAVKYLAIQHKQLKFEASEATLVIYAPSVVGLKGSPKLAWQMKVGNVGMPLVRELVLVDAHSGQVTLHYSLIYDFKDRQIYDAAYTNADPGELKRQEGEPESGIVDVDKAYDYLGDTYDFYFNHHGRDSYDDAGGQLITTVRFCHDSGCTTTGHWVFATNRMYLGPGYASDEVVAHEFTHGVTDNEAGLIYFGESGALHETFSDMCAEWVDQNNGDGNDSPEVKWLLGEDTKGGVIRNMANPTDYNDPDRRHSPLWINTDPGGYDYLHSNNGVGNKLCYLLTDGDTFNGYTISAMGVNITAALFYECQTNLLTSTADYYDLYFALTQAAINLNFSEAQRNNIERACKAVEISTMLMAQWKFDQTSGATAPDSAGDHHGTLRNFGLDDSQWVNGKINRALDFDGLDDYVEADNPSSLIIPDAYPKSICLWLKVDDVNEWKEYSRIFTWYDGTNQTVVGLGAMRPDGKGEVGGTLNGNRDGDTYGWAPFTDFVLTTGDWHHICFTFNGLNTSIYLNGVQQNVIMYEGNWMFYDEGVFIGASKGAGPEKYFNGKIDDVRVYNWALDVNEIWNNADFNNDGIINCLDYGMFANNWRTTEDFTEYNDIYDLVDNNSIDFHDLEFLAEQWLWQMGLDDRPGKN